MTPDTPGPADVAQRQLEAYNARDVDAFAALFAEDATLHELGAAAPTTSGREAIRERYRDLFARSPQLHCTVLSRTTCGRAVVDLEHIVGRLGQAEPLLMMAIYEVEHGLIRRAHFVRPG